jgi:hypothetical protein
VFTLRELTHVIKTLHPHRAPGSELITAHTLQEIPHEGYQTLLRVYIFNAIRRLQYWPAPLKQAKIMVPKPGKNPTDVASYRPISLLPILSKLREKLLLKRIYSDTNLQDWGPVSAKHFQQYSNVTALQI